MDLSIIYTFEYLQQPVDVIITQVQCGQNAGSFVIKVFVKKTGREVSPRRANDLTHFSDLNAAKAAGETLGRRLLDASQDSYSGHRFRINKATRTL